MKDEFTAGDVRKLTGISKNLLTRWIERGFVVPTNRGIGSGSRHIFSLEDVFRIVLFMRMSSSGFSRPRAAGVAFGSPSGESPAEQKKSRSQIVEALSAIIAYREEKAKRIPPPTISTDSRPQRYIAFTERKEGTEAVFIQGQVGMMDLFSMMVGIKDFYVVNMSELAEDLLSKVEQL